MLNERDYFGVIEDRNEFLDYEEDVFCDELEGYTFCPYMKQKGGKNPRLKFKSQLRERFINLWSYSKGGYVRVPCFELAEEKKVFLSEANFNQYWEQICSVLLSSKRQLDLSFLETETREAYIGKNNKIAYRGKNTDIEKQRLISKRANAETNPKLCYVTSKKGNVVHYKACAEVKYIEDENITFHESFPQGYELCQNCSRRVWLRMGIKEETKYFNLYHKFLKGMKLSNKQYRYFFEDKGIVLHMDANRPNRLYIKCGEDNWYIQAIPQGEENQASYLLFHNNYTIVENKDRIIYDGYHKQKVAYKKPSELLHYMCNYDWTVHLKEEKEPEQAPVIVGAVPDKQRFWSYIKHVLSNLRTKIYSRNSKPML